MTPKTLHFIDGAVLAIVAALAPLDWQSIVSNRTAGTIVAILGVAKMIATAYTKFEPAPHADDIGGVRMNEK